VPLRAGRTTNSAKTTHFVSDRDFFSPTIKKLYTDYRGKSREKCPQNIPTMRKKGWLYVVHEKFNKK
jgi:hypothetical protein